MSTIEPEARTRARASVFAGEGVLPLTTVNPGYAVVVENLDIVDRAVFFLERPMTSVFSSIKKCLSENASLVLHIASALPGEGASTVARELAHVAASASWCRVLLLDGNPGSLDQASYFGLPTLPNVAHAASNNMRIETVGLTVSTVRFELASLSMGGPHAPCESEPGTVRSIYDVLRRAYQLTVVDCPPILGESDTVLLSDYADGVALVVRAGETRLSAIARAKARVEAGGGTIRGVILNGSRRYVPAFFDDKL